MVKNKKAYIPAATIAFIIIIAALLVVYLLINNRPF